MKKERAKRLVAEVTEEYYWAFKQALPATKLKIGDFVSLTVASALGLDLNLCGVEPSELVQFNEYMKERAM